MNILLVYPKYPDTYWSFKHALKFISKKVAVPPLGLITVSAMLPDSWNKRLVDLNASTLNEDDVKWADYVFISAMYVQKESVDNIINICKSHNVQIVAGGPLFTQEYSNYPDIDHFILNEAELTMPPFLKDLQEGRNPQRIYNTVEYAEMNTSPIPDFHLLKTGDYASMSLQVTRGCPYSCDFCEITSLLGHKVRMKETQQIISELDALYKLKWRGPISIVDDNFIGKRKVLKTSLLPAIKSWMEEHRFPFTFTTQTSINMADDEELMTMMASSGFKSTFIGIETPEEESLNDCKKIQNKNRDLLLSVKKIQEAGIQVSAGFIVGFDTDSPTVFQRQINFIQKSGIVSAMVGLLNAPKNTKLYERMELENRLTTDATGNNTDYSMNFVPKLDYQELLTGYKSIIHNIYSVKPYYKRARQFLLNYKQYPIKTQRKIQLSHINALIKSMIIIGILNKGRTEYWKFLFWTLQKRPGSFIDAITFTIYGFHFRSIYELK